MARCDACWNVDRVIPRQVVQLVGPTPVVSRGQPSGGGAVDAVAIGGMRATNPEVCAMRAVAQGSREGNPSEGVAHPRGRV